MWFGLINEIKFWFTRTFITRNCWMSKGNTKFSWSDDEWPRKSDWVECKDCVYSEDCVGREYNDGGCYSGERMEDNTNG